MDKIQIQNAVEELLRGIGVDSSVMILIHDDETERLEEEIDDLEYQISELKNEIHELKDEIEEDPLSL